MLERVLTNKGISPPLDFIIYPEIRNTVIRLSFNAGVKHGKNLVRKLSEGGDIERTGQITREKGNASRKAVLHMARGMHLSQKIFGLPADNYRPRDINAKRATMLVGKLKLHANNAKRLGVVGSLMHIGRYIRDRAVAQF